MIAYIAGRKKHPLIIHVCVCGSFILYYKGMSMGASQDRVKTCLKQLLPWFDVKPMIRCIRYTVQSIYTAPLIIQGSLPSKCDQSGFT